MLQYATPKYTTIHYAHYTTPQLQLQLQLQLHYTNYATLQLQLTTTTPLHYNYTYTYNYKCTTPHYIQQLWWGDHCNHCNRSRKHNSNQLSVHQWIRSATPESQQPTSRIGFLFLKLPPLPCALLLVIYSNMLVTILHRGIECQSTPPCTASVPRGASSDFEAGQSRNVELPGERTRHFVLSWQVACNDHQRSRLSGWQNIWDQVRKRREKQAVQIVQGRLRC